MKNTTIRQAACLLSVSLLAGCGGWMDKAPPESFPDPLGLGFVPRFPAASVALAGQPGTPARPVLMAADSADDPFDISKRYAERPAGQRFTPVRMTSGWGLGVQATVWALAAGNWLWGYSPAVSGSFGEAPNWFVADQPDGTVTFVNALPNGEGRIPTCMEPYGSGVIHQPCGIGNAKASQRFRLLPLANRGVMIYSEDAKKCLTTATAAQAGSPYAWSLTLGDCDTRPGAVIDRTQTWTLTPWPIDAAAIAFKPAA